MRSYFCERGTYLIAKNILKNKSIKMNNNVIKSIKVDNISNKVASKQNLKKK